MMYPSTAQKRGASKALTTCARIVGSLYHSGLWAMVAALLLSKWTWFEMRVNVGLAMYGIWAILFLVCLWRARRPFGPVFTIANAAVCTAASVVLSRSLTGVQVIPACLVREGLMQPQWVIADINMALVSYLAIGLALSIVFGVAASKPAACAS